jgi:hypothetical protein
MDGYIRYGNINYDVSVVEVKEPMNLKEDYAKPKALVDENEYYKPGTVCVVFGYGLTTVCI